MTSRRPRVVVAGTFEPEFARNRVVLRLLGRAGCEVRTVHEPLWGDRRYALVDEPKALLVGRAARAYARLVWRLLRVPRPDLVLVLYPGYFDVPVVALIARLRRLPVVFDTFISLHDTLTGDRALRRPDSVVGVLSRWADRSACASADLVIADTPAHARYFSELTRVPPARFRVLWLGADEAVFSPVADSEPDPSLVVFHGTFVPLQGLETVVRAAKLLEPDGVKVRIIGDGQERGRIEHLVSDLGAGNVELTGMLPLSQLPEELARAAVVLGIFGESPKAARVIPNKVYEALCMGRPVVTADTEAMRALDGAVAVVPPGDPGALAAEVRALLADPERREQLAARGHARYLEGFGEATLTDLLAGILDEVTAS